MSPSNQLLNAINAFKQWRATRKKTTHKTPEALQQQVVELLLHYSRGTISNALGLSGSQVKRWQHVIHLTLRSRILLGIEPADFRCGIDGFSARCRLHLGANPQSGALYMFIDRNKTMIRALRFDGTGFWLMTKRLSKGKFQQRPSPKHPKLHSVTAVY
jgi:hypothetical protein